MRPSIRIPYTDPFPAPTVVPRYANTLDGAIYAVREFLFAQDEPSLKDGPQTQWKAGLELTKSAGAVFLTGAGISVASGLADYRGSNGMYRRKKPFHPIFYSEFMTHHDTRKRYWSRSFFGWPSFLKARPNRAHKVIGQLGNLGIVDSVITQNVDFLHQKSHPGLPTVALHGSLPFVVCNSCGVKESRGTFQERLQSLNPNWAHILIKAEAEGLLSLNADQDRNKIFQTNADGDMEVFGASHNSFRYPACLDCSINPTHMDYILTDADGSILEGSTRGIFKPDVVMFGQDISQDIKLEAEQAVKRASRMLIIGSSLATHSAWRLAAQARDQKIPIGIINIGGVRGEDKLLPSITVDTFPGESIRIESDAADVLEGVLATITDR